MSWQLDIYTPAGTLLATYDPATPGGLDGGLRATVMPSRDCQELEFRCRNDVMQLGSRYLVRWAQDGETVFWGPAVVVPAAESPGAGPGDGNEDDLERVLVRGGSQLLADSVVGPRFIEESTEVAEIAAEFFERYGHPALGFESPNFPATGRLLSIYYKPDATLEQVLKELAEAAPGTAVGVDRQGDAFFRTPAGQASLSYANIGVRWLPQDSSDLVSEARLVVAGNRAGLEPALVTMQEDETQLDYAPLPAQMALGTLDEAGAQRAFAFPSSVSPFLAAPESLSAEDSFSHGGFANPEAVLDGDGETYAFSDGETGYLYFAIPPESENARRCFGFRMVYESSDDSEAQPVVRVVHTQFPAGGNPYRTARASYQLEPTNTVDGESAVMVYAVFLPDAHFAEDNSPDPENLEAWWTSIYADFAPGSGSARVYEFYPLILDMDTLSEIAESKLREAQPSPALLTVPGYVAPAPEVVVPDWPGGSRSFQATRFEYEYSDVEGMVTRITTERDTLDEAEAALSRWARLAFATNLYELTMAARE